jgi:hypothetical protein
LRKCGTSDGDPLESRSTPQEEIARGGSAGQAIEEMHRLRRKARGEEMTKDNELLELAKRLEDIFKNHTRAPACGAYPSLTTTEIDNIVSALRLAAQADAPLPLPTDKYAVDDPWCRQADVPQSPNTVADALSLLSDLFSETVHETWTKGEVVEVIEDFAKLRCPVTRPDGNSK